MARTPWVDVAKSLAIYLVVLGHAHGLPDKVRMLIYAVHVPAFLMLSGYLLPRDFAARSFSEIRQRQFRPYFRVYFLFSGLSMILMALEDSLRGAPVWRNLRAAFEGVLYGVEGPFDGFVHENAPLWYLTFLSSALLFLWLALQGNALQKARWPAPVLLLLFAVPAALFAAHWWPWYLNFAGIGGLLLWIGFAGRPWLDRLMALPRSLRALCLLGLCPLALVLALSNGTVNLNRGEFGDIPFLFLPCAVAGTTALCLFGSLVPSWRLWQRLSENTLVIFCTHIFLIHLTRDVSLEPFGPAVALAALVIYAAVVTFICLLLSEAVMPWLRRYMTESLRPVLQKDL